MLIKEVPDMEKVKFDSDKGVVNRAGAPAEINPFDENALQAAVNLKNKYDDIEVTVMTMGPPRAEKTLRRAYACGADRLVLVSDPKFGGSDTFATSRVLAAAVRCSGPYDLILCGEKSVDGDTAQVGAEVAAFLDIPHSYYAGSITPVSAGAVEVQVEDICGFRQKRIMNMPALCSVTKNIAAPLLPTLKRRLESLAAPVETLSMSQLADFIAPEQTGFAGSPTKVSRIVIPGETTRNSLIFRENPQAFAEALTGCLAEKGILR